MPTSEPLPSRATQANPGAACRRVADAITETRFPNRIETEQLLTKDAEGIALRILSLKPGESVRFRTSTDELPVPNSRRCWGEVFQELVEKGFLIPAIGAVKGKQFTRGSASISIEKSDTKSLTALLLEQITPVNEIFEKAVFSTGEIAKILGCSQQTSIRLFDRGELVGFKVPGSKFRRIPRQNLLEYIAKLKSQSQTSHDTFPGKEFFQYAQRKDWV